MLLTIISTAIIALIAMFIFQNFFKNSDPELKKINPKEKILLNALHMDDLETFTSTFREERFAVNYCTYVGCA